MSNKLRNIQLIVVQVIREEVVGEWGQRVMKGDDFINNVDG